MGDVARCLLDSCEKRAPGNHGWGRAKGTVSGALFFSLAFRKPL